MPKRDIILSAAGFEYYTTMIPVLTKSSSTATYLTLLSVTGGFLGGVSLGTVITGSVAFQRYKDILYMLPSGTGNIFRVNLKTFTVLSTLTLAAGQSNVTQWTRVSDSQLLHVDTINNAYDFLNMATGVITRTTGYTASTQPGGWTGGQGLTSFYDRTTSGLVNFKNRVYWSAGANNSSYNGEINTATFSGTTLSARTVVVPATSNYSRMWGSVGNSTTGVVTIFDSNLYKILGDSSSATYWGYTGSIFLSGNYSTTYAAVTLSSNLYLYGGITTDNTNFTLGYINFGAAAGTQPYTSLGVTVTNSPLFIYQINSSGHVAVIDVSGTGTNVTMRIYNGATLVNTYSNLAAFNSTTNADRNSQLWSCSNNELAVYNT